MIIVIKEIFPIKSGNDQKVSVMSRYLKWCEKFY